MSNISERIEQLSPLKKAMLAIDKMQAKISQLEQEKNEPIAIIGLGCRFPGDVDSPQKFWQLLHNGQDTTRELPTDRWDMDAYYDPNPGELGKIYTRYGCFLSQVDQFDADFFGISPREAMSMDPQQRLLLEVSWEALEAAGQIPERLKNTQAGVFVGVMYSDYSYRFINTGNPTYFDTYTSSGVGVSFNAGRLSYLLGLHGPSMVMDTACSSSLVSVHLACQSLRSRECNIALAGGVNLILSPEVTVALSRLRALAPDGRCKTFDAAADGYARGEGCGMIILKRLSDALADGDNILAVIRGSAVNHNGASSGLTVPNGLAQQTLMKQALENAKIKSHQVSYVEAHGTGTSLGDPIEVRSLGAVYSENRDANQPLYIGSVKTNIGHLESAAGIAGLIKVVLALQHQEIPPHLHLQTVNPHISLAENKIQIPQTPTPWTEIENRRIAGLSSFGLSGINTHLIIESAPEPVNSKKNSDLPQTYLLPLSAQTPNALRDLVSKYQTFLTLSKNFSLAEICYNASLRRSHYRYRLAIISNSLVDVQNQLEGCLENRNLELPEPVKKAFIFSESDSNWWAIGRELLAKEPVFREILEKCDRLFIKNAGWSLLTELEADKLSSQLNQSPIAKAIIVTLQIALAKLWIAWGIKPDMIAGEGLGEIAAAYIAEVLDLESAIQLLFIQIAHQKEKTFDSALSTQIATIPIYSRITGNLGNGQGIKPLNWGGISANSSSLTDIVNCLIANGCNTLIEINSEPVLTEEFAQKLKIISLSNPNQANIRTQLLENLGKLYTLGCQIAWDKVYNFNSRHILLPTYPWQRERHWLDIPEHDHKSVKCLSVNQRNSPTNHPFLGYLLGDIAHLPGQYLWEVEINIQSLPYLKDHQIQGRIILPGAAYIEMALSATKEVFGAKNHTVKNVSFQKPLFLSSENSQTVQILLDTSETEASFKIFSRSTKALPKTTWILHATGNISLGQTDINAVNFQKVELDVIQNRCQENLSAATHYATMASYGLEYGTCFQGVQQIWRQEQEVLAKIQLPENLQTADDYYQIHPVILDSAFQTFGAAKLPNNQQEEKITYLPVGLERLTIYGQVNQKLWSHLLLKPQAEDRQSLEGDIFLLNEQGEVIVEIIGFRGQRLDSTIQKTAQFDIEDWFYKIQWQPQPINQNLSIIEQQGHWLIFVDSPEVGQRLASLLGENGDTSTLVFPEEIKSPLPVESIQINPTDFADFQEILHQYIQKKETPCKGIIYCWGWNSFQIQGTRTLPENPELLSCAALYLTQVLVKTGAIDLPRLWIVTQGIQAINHYKNNSVSLLQSTLWGLGKVIILEHPEVRCTLVDLSSEHLLEQLPNLVQEIKYSGNENQIAWREQTRYVARLVRSNQDNIATSLFTTDATYLITGGMGGLGLVIAEWMVAQGARHLALMGRSTPSEKAQKTIAQMEKMGAVVQVVTADVSQSQQVADALDTIEKSMPPIQGIMHAAAVLDDGILLQLNQKRFQKIIAPKILGAWNLHIHTLHRPLEFFALFSSAASLIGSPGQGNYSAANAFLDALADYRQSQSLTGLSINWGAWSEVGLAASQVNENDKFANSGFGSISPSQGLTALARLLHNKSSVQVGVLPANWPILKQTTPALAELPLLQNLMSEAAQISLKQQKLPDLSTKKRSQLLTTELSEREPLLTTWLREYIAYALRLPTEKLDIYKSLNHVNLDSLIAIELKNWIEAEIGINFRMAELLEGPSITELATQILAKFNITFIQEINPEANQKPSENIATEDWEDGEL
ncbi:type I polyketide synthase [Anabaena cylindrica UHCC 0172]|uniref:type I polyketide synthase n=1 Tax=Anabaena cylindrica TaxID=1165 RepID=UPI002B20CC52|nr:type I polyketide synthase [Anabaena cylindrica]MEA5550942.1 type I polyketide synthase [Anabaena cylindrica UHCC 0172]